MRINFYAIIVATLILAGGILGFIFIKVSNDTKKTTVATKEEPVTPLPKRILQPTDNIIEISNIEVLDSQVTLSWEPVLGESENKIYHIIANDNELGTTRALKYAAINLDPLKIYPFFIEAYDENGKILGRSKELDITTKPNPNTMIASDTVSPDMILDLSSSNVTQTSAILSWTTPSDPPSGESEVTYEIKYSTNPSDVVTIIENSISKIPGITQQYTLNNLTPGKSYQVFIVSKDLAGNTSGPSNTIAFNTKNTLPSPVPTPIIKASTKFIVNNLVRITLGSLNIRQIANGTILGTQSLGSIGSVIGGPVNAGGLNWWNVNFNSGVDGWAAENYLAKAVLDNTAPTIPTGLSAVASSSSQINLSWTASTDAVGVAGYKIYRCSGAGCTPSTLVTTTTLKTYSNSGLNASTLYRYSVSAYDAAQNVSAVSAITQATTRVAATNQVCGSASHTVTCTAADITPHNTRSDCWVYLSGPATSSFSASKAYDISNFVHQTYDYIDGNCGSNIYDLFIGTSGGHAHSPDAITSVISNYYIGPFSSGTPPTSDTIAPTIPIGLSATVISSSQINLSWTASTDAVGVVGYKVYRNNVFVASTSNNYYNDMGLSPSTQYSYTITAFDAKPNYSNSSAIVQMTTRSNTDLPPTISLTSPASGATVSGSSVVVSASAFDDVGIAGVQFILDGVNINTEVLSFPYSIIWDTLILGNGNHLLSALARDTVGNLTYTPERTIIILNNTADNTAPTVPAGLTANAVSATQVNLSWNSSADNVAVAGYNIKRCSGASCTNFTQIATSTVASYSDTTGLTAATVYNYSVSAFDARVNTSAISSPVQVTTLTGTQPDTTPPVISAVLPTTGTIKTAGTTQVTLSLTTNENATCKYSTTAGVAYASMTNTFTTTGTTGHSTAITVTNGTTYNRYVKCKDVTGNSNPSDTTINFSVAAVTDTTPPVISAVLPTTGTIKPVGTTQVTLSLTTNENATCKYSTTAGIVYTSMTNTFTTTGGTSHSTAITVANGTSYNRYVRCQDTTGNANTSDTSITFSVAAVASSTCGVSPYTTPCKAADISPHNTKADCWVYLSGSATSIFTSNKAYNISTFVHSKTDYINNNNLCGKNIYDYVVGTTGGHAHSNGAINTTLQRYYIGPFQP